MLVFYITLILLLHCEHGIAQSLTGTTGLLTIPTAEMPEDGEISFGTSLLNKKHFGYWGGSYRYKYHGMANFITLGYLPFLEITPRLTRFLDFPDPQATGDRMVSIRLRLLRESEFLPSVVFGVHSPFSTSRYFNSSYLVVSKNFRLPHTRKIGFHLGYGVDFLDAKSHQFIGVFGGVSFSPHPSLTLMLEHDAEKFNSGVRLTFFDRVELLVAFLNFNALSGSISYKFKV